MNKDILLCGVGGQGTVLASKLIASAAMHLGNTAHSAETIGMAQRGGSVTSHIRIGNRAFSPLIPLGKADIILAFEPSEYLNKKCKCVVVDADELCKPFGSSKFFNVAILGVAVGTNATGLNADTIMYEIEHRVPERFVETNKAAFLAGIKIGEKYGIN